VARFAYCGEVSYKVTKTKTNPDKKSELHVVSPADKELGQLSSSSALLKFSLFSDQSGFRNKSVICRLKVRQMSKGQRRILRQIASRDLVISDSQLVKKKGVWYFQLAYMVPAQNHHLDETRTAELVANGPGARRPFTLHFPDGETWDIGNGLGILREYQRLEDRRAALRFRYKKGFGRGHGRGRYYQKSQPYEGAHHAMSTRLMHETIADVIKQCILHNCGSLDYREPSIPLRDRLWFAKKGFPFNWTFFQGSLVFQTKKHTITMTNPLKRRMKTKEFKERFGGEV
jgi:hypothetical protein